MTVDIKLSDSRPKRLGVASGLRFDVPILSKHVDHASQSELLLLGWCLLLHRYSSEGHCQFAWGICDNGGLANPAFDLNTSGLAWTPDKLLSEALADVQSYIQQYSASDARLTAAGTSLFFNDESIPDNLSGKVSWDGNAVQWVRTRQLHEG